MIVAWNWLKNMVDLGEMTPDEASKTLTSRGLEVEGLTREPSFLRELRVGRLAHILAHPKSDRLHIVDVDLGEDVTTRVVCGAPGIEEGWLVPFAPIGTVIGDLEIKPSEIRGEMSYGMLCSERELGLGQDHGSLLRLPKNAKIGGSVLDALALDAPSGISPSYACTLEIGLTPDRGDCLSHLGVARELAASLKRALKYPEIKNTTGFQQKYFVRIEAGNDCPRYFGALLSDVVVGPSPAWLRRAVESCGARSINNVVDVTNFVCFELGHPMHAFDRDKLADAQICVRRAKTGESIEAINHENYKLSEEDLVITDGRDPIAIAGVMGGAKSEVSEETTRIVLEVAAFRPTRVRKTAKRLGLNSESSHRFERFVDPEGVVSAAARAIYLLELCQEKAIVVEAIDDRRAENVVGSLAIPLRKKRISAILGVDIADTELESILTAIGFDCKDWSTDTLELTVPSWRSDITRDIDVIEEICRGYGLDRIPSSVPDVSLKYVPKLRESIDNPTKYPVGPTLWARSERKRHHQMRECLIGLGLSECVHYSFMEPSAPARLGFTAPSPVADPMLLANPMSSEQSAMRTTLLPGMLAALKNNVSQQQKSCSIFEIGTVFHKAAHNDITLLAESSKLSILLWGEQAKAWYDGGARCLDVYDLKGIIQSLAHSLDSCLAIEQNGDAAPWLHGGVQARICLDSVTLGHFGELHPKVLDNYKLDGPVYIAEFDIAPIIAQSPENIQLASIPRFPRSSRDNSLLIADDIRFETIAQIIESHRPAILESWELFDLYRGKQVEAGKQSISLSFRYRDPLAHDVERGHTLTDSEVNEAHEALIVQLKQELKAEIR